LRLPTQAARFSTHSARLEKGRLIIYTLLSLEKRSELDYAADLYSTRVRN
jgi:hypothetical protein